MQVYSNLSWIGALILNFPLLLKQLWLYFSNKTLPPAIFKIKEYKFWVRNINSIGILHKALMELNGPRFSAYKNSDVFIDVGGHAGAKSLAANYANPNLKIFLFEPNPLNMDLLRLSFNGLSNIELVEQAIGDHPAVLELYFDPDHLDTASLNSDHYFLNKNRRGEILKKSVGVITLDSYFINRPLFSSGYLKIDVESAEIPALIGARETLKNCRYLEIEITQSEKQCAANILHILIAEFEFNILDCDFIGSESGRPPRAMNLLLERRA